MRGSRRGKRSSRWRVRLVAALTLATFVLAATQSSALSEREIVPGKSIGEAALGMSRKTIEHRLKSPDSPKRSHNGNLYSLTYHYPYRTQNPGKKLIIVFKGLHKGAKARYMVTFERSLGTRPDDVGVHDRFFKMLGSYPSVSCYHSNSDGTREPDYEDNQNFECELHKNGGYTYFSYHSFDVDPEQRIGAIAVSSIKID